MKLLLVLLLCAAGVGCGYGSHSTTPPTPASTPTIGQLVPPNVVANSGQFSLEVDGTAFAANAVVNFNGAKMTTTFVSASKLMATVPNSSIGTAGTVPVTVTNQAVTGGLYGGGTTAVTSQPMNFSIN
ncbi:MAG TPA: IPT/TIG domain-containing protein [Terriglobales bacterium]|nr:IPT/TIG domain-containing protein [Terriglobales bacterium]